MLSWHKDHSSRSSVRLCEIFIITESLTVDPVIMWNLFLYQLFRKMESFPVRVLWVGRTISFSLSYSTVDGIIISCGIWRGCGWRPLILKRTLEGNAEGEAKRAKMEGKKGSREWKAESEGRKRRRERRAEYKAEGEGGKRRRKEKAEREGGECEKWRFGRKGIKDRQEGMRERKVGKRGRRKERAGRERRKRKTGREDEKGWQEE